MTSFRQRLVRVAPSALLGLLRQAQSGDLFSEHGQLSFSQEGEDLLIERLTEDQETGFYVDVGAHHPTRFSNTYKLYRRGWRGINIDPTPGVMGLFRKKRPRDINLDIAIADKPGHAMLHVFDEPALNSTNSELSATRAADTDYRLLKSIEVPAAPLRDVLLEFLPPDYGRIDLMTIDVEGADFDVLRSNDWSLFRPRILIFEALSSSLEDVMASDELEYLSERGFTLYAKLVNSVILTDSHSGTS